MVVEGGIPDPREARSAAEFVALLRVVKDGSGLTFRELTRRADAAGDVLPRSTIANMLARASVPREELLAAFLRACGREPAEMVDWLAVREELAARGRRTGAADGIEEADGSGAAGEGADGDGRTDGSGAAGEGADGDGRTDGKGAAGEGTGGNGEGRGRDAVRAAGRAIVPAAIPPSALRRRRAVLVAAASLVALAALVVTAVVLVREERPGAAPVGGPVEGRTVQLRSVRSGLCFSEERGSESGRLFETPCDGPTIPDFSLKPLGDDVWRIVTDHPDYGLGCTGVWDGAREAGASMQDQECGRRGPAEEFRIEPVGHPVEGYRIRPVHTRLCVGTEVRNGRREAELVQTSCDGAARTVLFSFDPVTSSPAP
ncbi:helix-turn-helix domain-containing protein [Streptomyces sp. NPDC032161]|uniref:RICIN domain-containing protein n=1 Tax=unclassified Streptomyces TaxID=2593676 RepID=UPI0033EB374D